MQSPLELPQFSVGQVLAGKYRLVRELGQGAMGVVWAAVNEATSADVALKLIRRSEEELRQRLMREARAYGSLRHKNVIEIYDVAHTDTGDPFLVMQLLHGETLADLLVKRGALPPEEAASIARDVARALGAAHEKGIVHRDLKPANIFLHHEEDQPAAIVKVLDFGVSKNIHRKDTLKTAQGGVLGSPLYMSPEQALTQPDLDGRTDIWSLGVILFEMLAGKRPFGGSTPAVVAAVLYGKIPDLAEDAPQVPAPLAAITRSCLTRDKNQRASEANAIAEALGSFLAAPPPNARPEPRAKPAKPELPDRSPDSERTAIYVPPAERAARASRMSSPELSAAAAAAFVPPAPPPHDPPPLTPTRLAPSAPSPHSAPAPVSPSPLSSTGLSSTGLSATGLSPAQMSGRGGTMRIDPASIPRPPASQDPYADRASRPPAQPGLPATPRSPGDAFIPTGSGPVPSIPSSGIPVGSGSFPVAAIPTGSGSFPVGSPPSGAGPAPTFGAPPRWAGAPDAATMQSAPGIGRPPAPQPPPQVHVHVPGGMQPAMMPMAIPPQAHAAPPRQAPSPLSKPPVLIGLFVGAAVVMALIAYVIARALF